MKRCERPDRKRGISCQAFIGRDCYWFSGWDFGERMISIRRFCCLPSGESFDATGAYWAIPTAIRLLGSTFSCARYLTTCVALEVESSQLLGKRFTRSTPMGILSVCPSICILLFSILFNETLTFFKTRLPSTVTWSLPDEKRILETIWTERRSFICEILMFPS